MEVSAVKKKRIIILVLFVDFVIAGALVLFMFARGAAMSKYSDTTYTEIPFEKIAQYEISPNNDNTLWFAIRDASFNGWFTAGFLEIMGVDIIPMNEIIFQ
jgi:hypothetical protein